MPASQELTRARASARTEGAVLEVALEGAWRLDGETPRRSPVHNVKNMAKHPANKAAVHRIYPFESIYANANIGVITKITDNNPMHKRIQISANLSTFGGGPRFVKASGPQFNVSIVSLDSALSR